MESLHKAMLGCASHSGPKPSHSSHFSLQPVNWAWNNCVGEFCTLHVVAFFKVKAYPPNSCLKYSLSNKHVCFHDAIHYHNLRIILETQEENYSRKKNYRSTSQWTMTNLNLAIANDAYKFISLKYFVIHFEISLSWRI